VAFVPGKKLKYQRLRDFHVSGDDNVDWVEPKVPLPGGVDWTFRNAWLFWRPALHLYLILFSLVIAMLREGSARLAPFVIPILLQTGCLALAAMTQEFRYQFPIYMIGLLYGGFFLFCIPSAPPRASSSG
jgi:hypothetical protein